MPEQSSQISSEASTFRKLKAHGSNLIIEPSKSDTKSGQDIYLY